MRNKSNRLEEMFVSMVETSKASQEEQVKWISQSNALP
jgi:hypothetical protein